MHVAALDRHDTFDHAQIEPHWQWPALRNPAHTLSGGQLHLGGGLQGAGALIVQRTGTANYTANTIVDASTLTHREAAGLAVIGDDDNSLGIAVRPGTIEIRKLVGGRLRRSATRTGIDAGLIYLKMICRDGYKFQFCYSQDGHTWQLMDHGHLGYIDGTWLPPWDRGLRVGLTCYGGSSAVARFTYFHLTHQLG